MRVLVIEDHVDVADLVGRALAKDGHRVASAQSVSEADARIEESEYDVAVLDLGLPDGSGLAWCKRIRANGIAMPILVLTAQSAIATRVEGLDAGADDFLSKPFAVAELRARVRALGRRGPLSRPIALVLGSVQLDFSKRRAKVDGREVPLTSREWSIVDLLTSRAGRVVSRKEILEALWGVAAVTSSSAANSDSSPPSSTGVPSAPISAQVPATDDVVANGNGSAHLHAAAESASQLEQAPISVSAPPASQASSSAASAAEASLEVIIGRIRKKLGSSFIRTIRGEGYAATTQ
jgi:two-component system, OmpR family, response regulator